MTPCVLLASSSSCILVLYSRCLRSLNRVPGALWNAIPTHCDCLSLPEEVLFLPPFQRVGKPRHGGGGGTGPRAHSSKAAELSLCSWPPSEAASPYSLPNRPPFSLCPLCVGSPISGLHGQGGGGTYNVHDGQHVLFHVSAPVVGHHHLVSHHQGLHIALAADGALQAWLATLCLIPQGPGGGWLQGTEPPRPPLPWLLIWMDNFWSFCCLLIGL